MEKGSFRQIIVPGKNTKKYHNYLNNIKENNVKAIMFQTSKKKVKKERKFDLDEIVLKIKSNIIKNIIIIMINQSKTSNILTINNLNSFVLLISYFPD